MHSDSAQDEGLVSCAAGMASIACAGIAHGVMRCPASPTRRESSMVTCERSLILRSGCEGSHDTLPDLETMMRCCR